MRRPSVRAGARRYLGLLTLPGERGLLDTVAPAGAVTEAFAVTVMAVVAGIALGNAVGGTIVDGASYPVAVLCAGAAAALGALAAALRGRTLTAPARTRPAGP